MNDKNLEKIISLFDKKYSHIIIKRDNFGNEYFFEAFESEYDASNCVVDAENDIDNEFYTFYCIFR